MIVLDGSVALVTGGSRGIGRATALALARAGCDICLTYLNAPREARTVAAEIAERGRRVIVVKADLSVSDDVRELCRLIGEEFGKLDILVANAGGGGFRSLLEVNAKQIDYAMHLNIRSLIELVQGCVPLLAGSTLERAKVVTITSLGGTRAMPNYGLMGTVKGALESLTRQLALELGPRGINVNCVCAGLVKTSSTARMPALEDALAARRARSLAGDRDLAPTDVANAVLCVVSPLLDTMAGQTLCVDCGTSIQV